ncbi:MAG: hypothetical protein GF383_09245 [Candidatus Lokiarchaeota archaeon]|nr:hypothetical protein [Candidatus Lokiarchaeota archaeon]MBD3340695.1 hypothetical protein [Candidatus Lokiarchaeota archaeon]
MQKNYYIYQKHDCNVTVNKMPIWFKDITENSDLNEKEGLLSFETHNNYDEVWGANAKMEISWIKKDRTDFLHPREVQQTIDMYNAINIVVTEKKREWLNTHEFTYWFGNRTKMIRKRYYRENVIHGLFYCELTERLFEIHTSIIGKHYEGFKPYIIEAFNSIVCH